MNNQKIEIADERIEQVVAVAKENIKVAITESKPQTFQVWEVDKVVEKTLEIMQPPTQLTLKDLEAQISDCEIRLAEYQQDVENYIADLAKLNALKVELEKVVEPAYQANIEAVSAKEIPIEEPPIKELPVTEEIIKP